MLAGSLMNCPNCISPLVQPEGGIAWCSECLWPLKPVHKPSYFQRGDRVHYVPFHARHDPNHDDCEDGIVLSVGKHDNIFVLYDEADHEMGLEDEEWWGSQATGAGCLVKLNE